MKLQIDNYILTTPIKQILLDIRSLTKNKYFLRMIDRGTNISISCPFHSDGQEKHPSCSIYTDETNDDILPGTCHCFACGRKSNLVGVVAHCLNLDNNEAKSWLIDNYCELLIEYKEPLPELVDKVVEKHYLDESILDQYNYYHPYMDYRKITPEVRKLFKIGYDTETDCITFPVWDDKNNLVFISKRSVKGKKFELATGKDKPVYGLNFIKQKNITKVFLVESQINCCTLWAWGYPAIALLGTGSKTQYEILKKSGIRDYCLCFDGDMAGDHGRKRFIDNMTTDCLITYKLIPKGKDVNDLTKKEFDNLPILDLTSNL